MVEQTPSSGVTLAIVGASGFIGTALCKEVAHAYTTIALTRSRHRAVEGSTGGRVRWQACDFFARADMREALVGVDLIVYLAHTRVPTARLDQARCSDMDVLQADNCALAAAQHGVRQIIYLSGLLPEGNVSGQILQDRSEIVRVLGSYGTPITVVRASLVVGPGSSAISFLADVARRAPVIPIPKWGQTQRQPIAVKDLIRAILYCLDDQKTFNSSFDVGGPDLLTTTEIVHHIARCCHRERPIRLFAWLPGRIFSLLLRVLSPSTHPGLINLFIEGIRYDMKIRGNPLQEKVLDGAMSFSTSLEGLSLKSPRAASLRRDRVDFERTSSVRSIQRVKLPDGWNAASLSDYYFSWLSRFVWPFTRSDRQQDGSWRIAIKGTQLTLLYLNMAEKHSSEHRRLYIISGGLLARMSGDSRGRMEFRDLEIEPSTIIAIHDFTPRLPWRFYNLSQATIHGWVMGRFQKHMKSYVSQPK